jgi:uncharacterized protein (UPF0264 family)
MTGMLASVNSLGEAALVLDLQADIIDLKQPEQGALGALETRLVRQIVAAIDRRRPVSATVGDLPMEPDVIFEAVQAMAETGVDYIKIGFFPGGDWLGTVDKLSALTGQHALIAVLFADTQPDLSIITYLRNAGFKGAMLDTMDKQKGSLMQVMDETVIGQFVEQTKTCQLLCGLAGSLRLADIPGLMPYKADYLGFRGALCQQHNRIAQLDTEAITKIRQAIADAV